MNTSATSTPDPQNTVAFQGELGANSHLACQMVHPNMSVLPCTTFDDVFAAVENGDARLAMIPIENSVAGRVADIHHLLPESGLFIVAEHFQRVNHQLLAPKGASLDGLKAVHSHVHALSQCRNFIRQRGLEPVVHVDTAGAARDVSARNDPAVAAIASGLAAEIYGLDVLASDIEDADHNTTRFIVMAREPDDPGASDGPVMTSFIFQVRNVPAALYKALGGFATNGVNMVKLESYQIGGSFNATLFYADIEGHPSQRNVELAMEELDFFSTSVRIKGTYPAHPYRQEIALP
ncbi:MAG: prephenate dehydratase [Rhodospirillales bacterium]|nr:prephenate dehydratase [Rhodospirillales bacterium]